MKASASWKKLKFARKFGGKHQEEKIEEEEDVLYKILPIPEPAFKNIISRNQDHLEGRCVNFVDSFANEQIDIDPDEAIAEMFEIIVPRVKASGAEVTWAHSDCNTEKKVGGPSILTFYFLMSDSQLSKL